MDHLILVPAYGRDYESAAQVRKDWEAGKDFKIANAVGKFGRWCGSYTSIRDFQRSEPVPEGSYIRYKKLTELTHIGIWEEAEPMEEADE
jgi:hypothetical protein